MDDMAPLAALFLAGFVAATLLPAQSELLLAGLAVSGDHAPAALIGVATAGNVLGSLVNWVLGRFLIHFRDRRWFPIGPAMIDRATDWYERWGFWSLLLAWAPIIGDPLTLVAGILRVNVVVFLVLVTLGKAARYGLIVLAV